METFKCGVFCVILANFTKICYTYGKQLARTGTSDITFGYNGRDGVVTDKNGLIYMRARYYSPEMRRFVNSDIIPGKIANAVTLNRYAYANANPAMNVDPSGLVVGTIVFGLIVLGGCLFLGGSSKQEEATSSGSVATVGGSSTPTESTNKKSTKTYTPKQAENAAMAGEYVPSDRIVDKPKNYSFPDDDETSYVPNPNKSNKTTTQDKKAVEDADAWEQIYVKAIEEASDQAIDWTADKMDELAGFKDLVMPDKTPPSVHIGRATTAISLFEDIYGIFNGAVENHSAGEPWQETVSDIGIGIAGMGWDAACGFIGAAFGSVIMPGAGTAIGAILFSGVGEYIYKSKFAPTFDNYYEYN